MLPKYIERPSPPYRQCVAISRISHYYEYPKHSDMFIWGIPCKYINLLDQEVSALCTCWIYDGTKQSLAAAKEMDSWFNNSPFKFIAKKEHNDFLLNNDQNRVIYKKITVKDCFIFFCKIREVIGSYKGIKNALSLIEFDSYTDKLRFLLKDIPRFNNETIDSEGRLNLYLFIMEHCLEAYNLDQSKLKAPLFKNNIVPNCKTLGIYNDTKNEKELAEYVTNYLKWFSEKYPMTFFVGVAAYKEYQKSEPRLFKRLNNLRLIKHRFRKR